MTRVGPSCAAVPTLGVEAFQLFAPLRENFQSLPGAALSMRRETPLWYLGMRLGVALSPMPDSSQTELVLWVRSEIEATAFASPRANTSFFGALLLGAEYQRFRGPAPLLGPEARGSAVGAGFAPGLRAGLELFRVTELARHHLRASRAAGVRVDGPRRRRGRRVAADGRHRRRGRALVAGVRAVELARQSELSSQRWPASPVWQIL